MVTLHHQHIKYLELCSHAVMLTYQFCRYLYLLLSDPQINKARIPILIACNKQDLSFTKAAGVIKTLLEKEL